MIERSICLRSTRVQMVSAEVSLARLSLVPIVAPSSSSARSTADASRSASRQRMEVAGCTGSCFDNNIADLLAVKCLQDMVSRLCLDLDNLMYRGEGNRSLVVALRKVCHCISACIVPYSCPSSSCVAAAGGHCPADHERRPVAGKRIGLAWERKEV